MAMAATYRGELMQEFVAGRRITTRRDAISLAHVCIAWTQRLVANRSPPKYLIGISLEPDIVDVTELHLVKLAINSAARCRIACDDDLFSIYKTREIISINCRTWSQYANISVRTRIRKGG
jgi:hypothetical protein